MVYSTDIWMKTVEVGRCFFNGSKANDGSFQDIFDGALTYSWFKEYNDLVSEYLTSNMISNSVSKKVGSSRVGEQLQSAL